MLLTTWNDNGHEMDTKGTMLDFQNLFGKFDNKENEASDAAPLSPGGAVADLSASEGTMGDDQALSPAMS